MLVLFLVSTVIACQSLVAWLAIVLLSVAIVYIYVIHRMVFDYLDLVARKMTYKEREARKIAAKELNITDWKNDPVPLRLRLERYWNFFIVKPIPESVLKDD